jgi:hypothetical protein
MRPPGKSGVPSPGRSSTPAVSGSRGETVAHKQLEHLHSSERVQAQGGLVSERFAHEPKAQRLTLFVIFPS